MANRRVLSIHQEHELLLKLEVAGLDESLAQRIIESPKNKLAKELVAAALGTNAVGGVFPFTVNYFLTVAEMVEAGHYDWKNSDVNNRNFPHDRSRGTEEVTAELIHFDRDISTDDALLELARLGYRPATNAELLAFGAKYPEKQREFSIIQLGSVWVGSGGDRDVSYLDGGGSERRLDVRWADYVWLGHCRFLAVRK